MIDWPRQRSLAFIALGFLTRVPIPRTIEHNAENLNAAARYFPAIGILVGAVAAATYAMATQLWPPSIAILLSMICTLLLTGAFHEDGFADSCDGFGGGWSREQVLAIMKDSRIGTYGAAGLGLMLALKFAALHALAGAAVIPALVIGHCWSRLLATSYLFDFDYAREDDSKVKPLATKLTSSGLQIAALTAVPLVFAIEPMQVFSIIAVLAIWRWAFGRYFSRRLGGYTGDCLGAAQQVAEVLIYLVLAATL
jgi:adenosylcobinamide-GDP ribazoletransferase